MHQIVVIAIASVGVQPVDAIRIPAAVTHKTPKEQVATRTAVDLIVVGCGQRLFN
ncbi:hypothetical protein D3C80_2005020 [compost metagenome]